LDESLFGIIWRPLKKIFLPSRRVQTIYLLDNTEKGLKGGGSSDPEGAQLGAFGALARG
jgi:hypothetical protein